MVVSVGVEKFEFKMLGKFQFSRNNNTSSRPGQLIIPQSKKCKTLPQRCQQGRLQTLVVCKVQSRRVAKVARQIEREIGVLLLNDRALQNAVCPERLLGDNTLSAIASVTGVQLSGDLQVAKVYISVFSDAAGKMKAWQGLQKLQGYVRRSVAANLNIRLAPEIRFMLDDSIERSERVMKLLDRVKQQEDGRVEAPPIAIPSTNLVEVEEEEGDEDFDELLALAADDDDSLGDDDDEGFFDDLESEPIGTSGISYVTSKEYSRTTNQYNKASSKKSHTNKKYKLKR
eukprot:TRINITY_DN2266_c0_g2_i2.p3 TRINITY_DN2266_c0_g2~~TRINITY_DN2266_c0_g2_i2.p3  ORF type:complete len:286 (-),score=51.25 TRINITY_DN2266_c0_g2_i2:421-1278(-)